MTSTDMTLPVVPGRGGQPHSRVPRLLAIAFLLAAAATGAIVWNAGRTKVERRTPGTNASPSVHPGSDFLMRVEVVRPTRKMVARTMSQPGTIEAFNSAELQAKVSGYLKTQHVDIGSRVKTGEVLAVLDVPEARDAVDLAAAALEQARAAVSEAEARIKVARADSKAALAQVSQVEAEAEKATATVIYRKGSLARIEDLGRRNAVPEEIVDEEKEKFAAATATERAAREGILTSRALASSAEARAQLAEAELLKARADVNAATAELVRARDLLGYATITSPYDGIVTCRNFHPGDFIRSATEGGTLPLLAVAKVDVMRVVVQVPDRDVPYTDPGDLALVRVDALGGRVFSGQVARLSNIETEADRTMRTEIDLPNPEGLLRSGMFGNVTITLEEASNRLSLPGACLLERTDDGKGFVYLVREGKVRKTSILVGKDNGIDVEILNGLGPDDQVILRYTGALAEGLAVRAVLASSETR